MSEPTAIYNPFWSGPATFGDLTLTLVSPSSREKLDDFRRIIVLSGAVFGTVENLRDSEALKRERELFNALEKGATVCVTFMPNGDPLSYGVTNRIGVRIQTMTTTAEMTIRRSEFTSFLKEFGAACGLFHVGDMDDVILETKLGTAGFARKLGKGVLILLSCEVPFVNYKDSDFMKGFLTRLLEAVTAYSAKFQFEAPSFIDSYRCPNESIVVSEIVRIRSELSKKEETLRDFAKLKEILWLRDDELVGSVIDFLQSIGIKAKRDEIREEDFWIVENGREAVIVEVKGLDKNLSRVHISQLDEHRAAREKPDDFPALLIVNSFNKASSPKEKDQAISPNEIKKAVNTNVLVLRTLDLFNAYCLVEKNMLERQDLLKIMKNERGWLRVESSEWKIIRG